MREGLRERRRDPHHRSLLTVTRKWNLSNVKKEEAKAYPQKKPNPSSPQTQHTYPSHAAVTVQAPTFKLSNANTQVEIMS